MADLPWARQMINCKVFEDGIGDFYHLLDGVKSLESVPNLAFICKDILIELDAPHVGKLDFFIKHFHKREYATVVLASAEEFSLALDALSKQKTAFIIVKAIYPDATLCRKLAKIYCGNICFSMSGEFSQVAGIPTYGFLEHGCVKETQDEGAAKLVPMNLVEGTQAVFIPEVARENPAVQLHKVLSNIENLLVRKLLLGEREPEMELTVQQCNSFLKTVLFIPGYVQHSLTALINFFNICVMSPLSKEYDSIMFFVNKIQVGVVQQMFIQGLLSEQILKLVIKTPEQEIEVLNRAAAPTARVITIVSGYRVEQDEDYQALYHCAQLFVVCSGDKTLESALANGLIPLYIPNGYPKEKFVESLKHKIDFFDYMQRLVTIDKYSLHHMQSVPRIDPDTVEMIMKEAFDFEEKEMQSELHAWKQAVMVGSPFQFGGESYQPIRDEASDSGNFKLPSEQNRKLFKFFAEGKNAFLVKLYFDCLQKIAHSLDPDFYLKWKNFCSSIKENNNLFYELPRLLQQNSQLPLDISAVEKYYRIVGADKAMDMPVPKR
jgi:hypothetical protein